MQEIYRPDGVVEESRLLKAMDSALRKFTGAHAEFLVLLVKLMPRLVVGVVKQAVANVLPDSVASKIVWFAAMSCMAISHVRMVRRLTSGRTIPCSMLRAVKAMRIRAPDPFPAPSLEETSRVFRGQFGSSGCFGGATRLGPVG